MITRRYPYILVLLILLSGIPAPLFAQYNKEIDSLMLKLETVQPDSARVLQHLQIAYLYDVRNPKKSLEHCQKAWDLAKLTDNKFGMMESSYQMGVIYQCDFADYSKALHWFSQSMDVASKVQNLYYLANVNYSLGAMFLEQGDTLRTFKYLTEAAKIATRNNDYQVIALSNIVMGEQAKDKLEQFAFYHKAVKSVERDTTIIYSLFDAWMHMGNYYKKRNQLMEAEVWYKKIVNKTITNVPHTFEEIQINQILAEAYYNLKDYTASEKLVRNVIASTKSSATSSDFYTVEAMRLLSKIYSARGYPDSAYTILDLCFHLNDSLKEVRTRTSAQQKMLNMQSEFDLKKRENDVLILETKSDKQQAYAMLLICGILLTALFAFYFYQSRQREYKQNERLASLNRTKDKILSILSHDVRSPLNALQNILHLFDIHLATPADVRTVTTQVRSSIHNLHQNLENLLLWAQSQQEDLTANPEQVNIPHILDEHINLMRDWADRKQVTITYDFLEDMYAFADPVHVRLAIQNVFTNALKFVPASGTIQIRCEHTAEQCIQVSFWDNGTGIPADDITKIFDPAVRYTRTGTGGEPGSGLGLSLTQELMALNNGTIQLESDPFEGTLVTLRFPLFGTML